MFFYISLSGRKVGVHEDEGKFLCGEALYLRILLHSDFDFVFSQKGVGGNFTFHGDDFYSGDFGFLERVGYELRIM